VALVTGLGVLVPAPVVARLPRARVVLGWLLVAHVVLKVLLYPLVVHAAPLGDETAYLNGGRALSNLLRDLAAFSAPDTAEVQRNVVASGWFMPGMSLVVTPLYLVVPDAPTWLVRAYLGLVTLVLLVLVVRYVARRLGPAWACVLVVLPGLVPSWVVFSFAAWGDLCAGLVLVVLVVHAFGIAQGLLRGEPPTVGAGVRLGLLAIALLYLRSSTSLLLAGLGVVGVVLVLALLRGQALRRAAVSLGLGAGLFLALLAPWSALASGTLGARVITTTTVPTVRAVTFGDRDELCFGPCDPDSTRWFRPVRYAREVARATGTSEVVVLEQMSSHALRGLGTRAYLEQVARNVDSYATQPNSFTSYLAPDGGRGALGRATERVAAVLTWSLYAPLLLMGVISMVFSARSSTEARVLDVLLTTSLGALLVQPFVHVSGGRYWTTAGPVVALAGFAFLRERVPGWSSVPAAGGAHPVLDRWLGRAQVLAASVVALVAVVLLVVSR
jgi:hypothetical protein